MPAIKALTVSNQSMPDVKGMGLKDALFLLENMNVKVQLKGKGRIVSQSVASGSAISKGQTIQLELQ